MLDHVTVVFLSASLSERKHFLPTSPTECRKFPSFTSEPAPRTRPLSMAEPPESSLPPMVLEKLRELNSELAEGELTAVDFSFAVSFDV